MADDDTTRDGMPPPEPGSTVARPPGDPDPAVLAGAPAGLAPDEAAGLVRADQRRRWRAGERVPVEAYLAAHPDLAVEPSVLLDLVYCEYLLAEELGATPDPAAYAARFPAVAVGLAEQLDLHQALGATGVPAPPDVTADAHPDGPRSGAGGGPAALGYEVLGELGRGGMGVVYKARQPRLNRVVALKTLHDADRTDAADVIRFLAEAEAVAAVRHPHVVQVFEFGQHAGRPYFAMEYLPGGSLRDRLAGSGPLPPAAAAALVAKVARGVQAAHDQQIVHRDLKPGNVLFDSDGTPKVTDFGLARRGAGSGLTRTQAVMGTPAYMAPEQARGEAKFLGPAADVHALGAVLYECLTGSVPFVGDDALVVLRRVAEDPPEPPRRRNPAVPRDLELVCLKCLEKEPADRYPTAAALADDLDRFVAGRPVAVRRVSVPEQAWRWCKRNRAVAGLLGLILLGSVTAAVVFAVQREDLKTALKASEDDRRDLTVSQDEARRQERAARLERLDSMISEARGKTVGRRPGQRFESLKLLDDATALARELDVLAQKTPDLRNALAAALAVPDLYLPRTWDGFPQGSESFDFSDDHSVYARTHQDGTCTVVRTADNTEVCKVPAPKAAPGTPRIPLLSGDGRTLLVIAAHGEAHVWRVGPPPQQVAVVPRTYPAIALAPGSQRIARPSPAYSADLRPDGRLAAVSRVDGSVSLVDLPGGRTADLPPLDKHGPVAPVLHPSEPRVILHRYDPPLAVVRDTGSGEVVGRMTGFRPVGAAWHPFGATLVVAGEGVGLRVYDGKTLRETATWPARDVLAGLRFNPSGDRLAGGGWAAATHLIDTHTGRTVHVGPPFRDGTALRWSPDGRRLAGPAADTQLGIWDVGDGREFRVLQRLPASTAYLRTALHPAGRLVAAATAGGVTLWDLDTGRQAAHLPLGGGATPVFGPDGSLWTPSDDRTLRWRLRDAGDGTGRLTLGPPEEVLPPACGLACAADGRVWVGVLRGRDDAFIWRPSRPSVPPVLPTGGEMGYVDVSPDGRWAVTAVHTFVSADLWDLVTGEKVRPLYTRSGGAVPAFSPDGKWLWVNTDGGRLLRVGSWEPGPVTGRGEGRPAFTADGAVMALETGRGTVRLIETESGRELVRLDNPHQDPLHGLVFAPDGGRLVGSSVGPNAPGVHVWELNLIRRQLAARGLDWAPGPVPDPPAPAGPIEVLAPIKVPAGPPPADENPWITVGRMAQYIALDPEQADPHLYRAAAWARLDKPDRAEADFDAAVRLRPQDPGVRAQRAAFLFGRGKYAAAAADVHHARGTRPGRPVPPDLLAQVALWHTVLAPADRRDPAKGLALAQEAVRRARADGFARVTLGIALLRSGMPREAITVLEQKDPKESSRPEELGRYTLALCHLALGDRTRAAAALREAADPTAKPPLAAYLREARDVLAAEVVVASLAASPPVPLFWPY